MHRPAARIKLPAARTGFDRNYTRKNTRCIIRIDDTSGAGTTVEHTMPTIGMRAPATSHIRAASVIGL